MEWTRTDDYKRRNVSYIHTTNETAEDASLHRPGTIWFSVLVSECILILMINAFTLLAFARNRHLRKNTTYLIINLTVADLLVGAVSEPLSIICEIKLGCVSRWRQFFYLTLHYLFPGSSLVNLSLISLERLHATLYPFKHCLVGKWVYFRVIISCWLLALLSASLCSVLEIHEPVARLYAMASYDVITLLIVTISYVIIIFKVKSSSLNHQPFGSLASDRKLSVTLFIVTAVSILTIFPWAINVVISVILSLPSSKTNHILTKTTTVLFYANSMVNPLIYAIRMQEFRQALKELIGKKHSINK